MKRLLYFFTCIAAAAACLSGVGCERHPASQTVPGYATDEAHQKVDEKEKMETPVGTGTNAPAYFPAQGH